MKYFTINMSACQRVNRTSCTCIPIGLREMSFTVEKESSLNFISKVFITDEKET